MKRNISFTRRQLIVAGIAALSTPVNSNAHVQKGDSSMQPLPTPQQTAWQEAELSMFFHFGMNTFTNREWGLGTEDPKLFNPTHLDCEQWVHTAREMGFKYLILTAKHHDGFCLWPSKYTDHSVKSSPWRNGRGDVVRDFARACHGAGVKMGLYLSPWDLNQPTYGDSPAYNRYFMNQLTELLTGYGEVSEVWFDGANGEGPNGKKQEYDWQGFYKVIRTLQPEALIAISGPDIRWVGNEDGLAPVTEWCIQPPDPVYHSGIHHPVWWPSECDTSIRPGWFWHPEEDSKVKPLTQLQDIYYRSVGHNSVLLLNVPPNSRGLLSSPDIARLREFHDWRDKLFSRNLAARCHTVASGSSEEHTPERAVDGREESFWQPNPLETLPWIELNLGRSQAVNHCTMREYIPQGQRVAAYTLERWDGVTWQPLVTGTTIGQKKIDRFETVNIQRLKLTIRQARDTPQIRGIELYNGE